MPSAPSGTPTEKVENAGSTRMGVSVRASRAEQPDHGPGLIAAAVALAVPVVSAEARFPVTGETSRGAGTRNRPAGFPLGIVNGTATARSERPSSRPSIVARGEGRRHARSSGDARGEGRRQH
jgi:hypothetical protein